MGRARGGQTAASSTRTAAAGAHTEPATEKLHRHFFGGPVAPGQAEALRARLGDTPRADLEAAESLLAADPATDPELVLGDVA